MYLLHGAHRSNSSYVLGLIFYWQAIHMNRRSYINQGSVSQISEIDDTNSLSYYIQYTNT